MITGKTVKALYGLVLAGGKSTRMQQDKGGLVYHEKDQRRHVYDLLSGCCEKTYMSCNREQAGELKEIFPVITDSFEGLGPMGGILSAQQLHPGVAWLVVACDLPFLSGPTLHYLIWHRDPSKTATAFRDPTNTFPEPLITIWEPGSRALLEQRREEGHYCPRKALMQTEVALLQPPDAAELRNINNPEQYREAIAEIRQGRPAGRDIFPAGDNRSLTPEG
ncbi:NTP transferase domain-containing protein [Compostibacter hankyongensis]|uniref:MobA-like NTP transferase domain-containing protein n=1 Tax=Compostibacter hankyongensis TaxID=1007089 RepID=A0ABP8FLU6_9BACT